MAKLIDTVHDSWKPLIQKHLQNDGIRYCLNLYKAEHVSPPMGNVFKAFTLPKDKVRIVILGLSPYHTIFQHGGKSHHYATGLAMGIPEYAYTLPPTLSELEIAVRTEWTDKPYSIDQTLKSWHDQGIMLLNTSLTVILGSNPKIHVQYWRDFITEVIQSLNTTELFILLGSEAQSFKTYCNAFSTVIKCPHPVKYRRTGNPDDRLAGKGAFYYIQQNFPDIKL